MTDDTAITDTTPDLTFASFLKFWRRVHDISQETLAERLDSSPRHISRLENGSSRPSEHIIEEIAAALSLGERDRNHLRIAAGYGPKQRKIDFHSDELKWLRKAMTLTLRAMEPYPTTLIDHAGNILMVNRAWVGFYGTVMSKQKLDQVSNHIDFIFNGQGAGGIISGWEDTLSVILMSHQQAAMLSGDPDDMVMFENLLKHPNVPQHWQQRAAKLEPMASFRVQVDFQGGLKRFYSVSQTVGARGPAAYISEPKLTVSTLYPEDESLDLSTLMDDALSHPLLFY